MGFKMIQQHCLFASKCRRM